MARKPAASSPQPANLNIDQMRQAIPRLRKRIDELSDIDIGLLDEENGDNVLDDQVRKIDATLVDVFGHNTLEYNSYSIDSLGGWSTGGWLGDVDTSFSGRRSEIKVAKGRAISTLQSAVAILQERLGDEGDSTGKVIRAYEGLALHNDIARAASKLYLDGHYANAIEAAVKALNNLVRLRSGLEIDGTSLMEKCFSPNNPTLKFNALDSQSDKDEQKGFMQMFAGAVSGLRNPRAHGFVKDDPERALEFIAFVSLLAKLLEDTTTNSLE